MSNVGSVREWQEIAEGEERGRDGCVPLFYLREVQNKARSKVEGRICFDQKEYVEIFVPGEKHLRPNRPVTDADKKRWPVAYGKFQQTREETLDGTPVEQWPYLNRAQVAEMKANGIMTIEAIADIPDGLLERLGRNGRDIQKRAKQFLQPQSDTEKELRGQVALLEGQVREKDMHVENLTQRLDAMERQIGALTRSVEEPDATDSPAPPPAEKPPVRRSRRKSAAS